MIHDSILFNFQEIINDLREKEAKENKKEMFFKGQLEAITEETEFEDLPFYKEYLAAFDLEHDLKGVELKNARRISSPYSNWSPVRSQAPIN